MSVTFNDHLIEQYINLRDCQAAVWSEHCPLCNFSNLSDILLICNELLDEFNSVINLLHLPVVLLDPHLPGHEDAGERAQVLLLAARPLVGEDQLVGAVGELEIHIAV